MDEHGNVGRIRDALETFHRGDLDAYREFFDDDVVWFVRGTHPMAGAYRGIDALFDCFGRAREVTRVAAWRHHASLERKMTKATAASANAPVR